MGAAFSEARKSVLALAIAVLLPFLMIHASTYVYTVFDNETVSSAVFRTVGFVITLFLIKSFKLSIKTGRLSRRALTFGVLVGLGAAIPIACLSFLLRAAVNLPEGTLSPLEYLQQDDHQLPTYLYVILSGGVIPIFEETLFRIFVAQQLRRSMSLPWAIILSSAAFAVFHGLTLNGQDLLNFYQLNLLPVMLMGVILGMLYFKQGWPAAVAAHSVYNIYVHYSRYPWADWLTVAWFLLALAGLFFLILLFIPRFNRSIHEH